jgi:hypothetical protein
MYPLRSVVNWVPTVTACPSLLSTVAGVVEPRMVQGQLRLASGVTRFDAAEAGLEPGALVAETVKV